ncbi:CopG family ribbon-helix-helix protein [Gloeobacter violaceus]|uniref:CopG family ribbon-helix-helix protein n=1 Tax=Gloeobacter violaceus TaxID=33072 RepID=UPI000316BEF5|nr:ribbon-helix-helix protein, CopG family [Gloeobacter violaceus]
MSKHISFRIDDDKLVELDAIARREERDRSFIINRLIEDYLARERHWERRIREAMAAADRGEFATPEQVQAEFDKWRE